jgi:iron-sulfur cluster assembly accessory protein
MPLPHVTVTAAAEKFMRRMVRFSEAPAGGFRLTVSAGGCSGYTSSFTVDAAPQDGDTELSVNGLRLFLPAPSALLLDGATVDFVDLPTRSGLSFQHPNQAACACSSSGDAAPARPAEASVALGSLRRMVKAG